MRSRISHFLLCLSLIFFVGFGSSVKAFAVESFYNSVLPTGGNANVLYNSVGKAGEDASGINNYGWFEYANSSGGTTTSFNFNFTGSTWDLALLDSYDYYALLIFESETQGDFLPTNFRLTEYVSGSSSNVALSDVSIKKYDGRIETGGYTYGFMATGKIPDTFGGSIRSFYVSGPSGTYGNLSRAYMAIYQVPKSSSDSSSDIIAAIQEQTELLQTQIFDAADHISGTIENQYSGDPEQSFGVDDIITQHNEKMGVLSFSSDVMMDVLGLFSPDQTLSSELVFPSMSLTIAGQRQTVQLWPEYRFDLEELRQHWPTFINLMRTITTASVWLLVLRYCYKVFEKYFLAGGSS